MAGLLNAGRNTRDDAVAGLTARARDEASRNSTADALKDAKQQRFMSSAGTVGGYAGRQGLKGVEAARLGLKTAADSAASNAVLASTDAAITSQLAAPVTAELTAPVLTEAGTLAAGETTTVALQGAKTATDVAAATQAATAAAETAAATSAAAGSAGGIASAAAAVAPWVLGGVAVAYLLNELFD